MPSRSGSAPRRRSSRIAAPSAVGVPGLPRALQAAARVQQQVADVACEAPLVMAMRLTRMAAAGAQPGARDRAEMGRMGSEKVAAFQSSWLAMGRAAMAQQQHFLNAWVRMMTLPWWMPGGMGSASASMRGLQNAAQQAPWSIAASGIEPVRRRVRANVRRLGGGPARG